MTIVTHQSNKNSAISNLKPELTLILLIFWTWRKWDHQLNKAMRNLMISLLFTIEFKTSIASSIISGRILCMLKKLLISISSKSKNQERILITLGCHTSSRRISLVLIRNSSPNQPSESQVIQEKMEYSHTHRVRGQDLMIQRKKFKKKEDTPQSLWTNHQHLHQFNHSQTQLTRQVTIIIISSNLVYRRVIRGLRTSNMMAKDNKLWTWMISKTKRTDFKWMLKKRKSNWSIIHQSLILWMPSDSLILEVMALLMHNNLFKVYRI